MDWSLPFSISLAFLSSSLNYIKLFQDLIVSVTVAGRVGQVRCCSLGDGSTCSHKVNTEQGTVRFVLMHSEVHAKLDSLGLQCLVLD